MMFDSVKRVVYKPILDRRQKKVKKLLEEEGFTDEVLEKQLKINKKRAALDLPDESELVNGKYVQ